MRRGTPRRATGEEVTEPHLGNRNRVYLILKSLQNNRIRCMAHISGGPGSSQNTESSVAPLYCGQ